MIRINMIRPTPHNLKPPRPPVPPPPPLLTLQEALSESTYLYRAARPYGESFYVITDGVRFWTTFRNFSGMYVTEYNCDPTHERKEKLWRPVKGTENGWYLA